MLMDLFVSTSSKICGEAGKGWAVLTLISLGCIFTPKGRTLDWREVNSLLQQVCRGKKSSCNNRNSMGFFLLERDNQENPQLLDEYRRWEICWIYSELSLNCFGGL